MADQEPLDLAAYRADINRAHTEVGDIAAEGAHRRWRMSIPAQPDRDSDLLISAGLRRGERLADEVERLRGELADAHAALGRSRTALAAFDGRGVNNFDVPTPREVLDAWRAALDRPKLITGNAMKRRPSEELIPIHEDDDLEEPEDDEPSCWAEGKPGSGVRCGLEADHDGDHHFNLWTEPRS